MSVHTITCKQRKPGPFPAKRRCKERGCETYLHRFHDSDRCYLHAEPKSATLIEQRESLEDLMAEAA